MNLRILIAREWEKAWVSWRAYRERSPKISNQFVHTGKYRYIKCTRLRVQGKEREGGRSESDQHGPRQAIYHLRPPLFRSF